MNLEYQGVKDAQKDEEVEWLNGTEPTFLALQEEKKKRLAVDIEKMQSALHREARLVLTS